MRASSDRTSDPFDVWYEPDTHFICIRYAPGKVQESHAKRLTETVLRYLREHCAEAEAAYFLVDIRDVSGMSAEARKVFADAAAGTTGQEDNALARLHFFIGTFGGSFTFRVLLTMLIKALQGVSKQIVGTVEADEGSARAWLTERRQSALAAHGASDEA